MIQIDIEMPKNCYQCPLVDDLYHICKILPGTCEIRKDVEQSIDGRSKFCPLVEVKGSEEHE